MSSRSRIALIDYGMGNLRSVSKAVEKNGGQVHWVHSRRALEDSDILILPGVGAFSQAVINLQKLKLFDPIRNWIDKKKPFLGICLGYQLLFEKSEEGPNSKALGLEIFKGKVIKFPKLKNLRVPHMGWNRVVPKGTLPKDKKGVLSKIFSGIGPKPYFYFVHSYFPDPKEKEIILTECDYGVKFASSIYRENLFACQFHPEKSGLNGLTLIKNFLNLYR